MTLAINFQDGMHQATIQPGETGLPQPGEAALKPMETPHSQPMEALSQPMEALSQPIKALSQPMDAALKPIEAPLRPMETSSQPKEALPQPTPLQTMETLPPQPGESSSLQAREALLSQVALVGKVLPSQAIEASPGRAREAPPQNEETLSLQVREVLPCPAVEVLLPHTEEVLLPQAREAPPQNGETLPTQVREVLPPEAGSTSSQVPPQALRAQLPNPGCFVSANPECMELECVDQSPLTLQRVREQGLQAASPWYHDPEGSRQPREDLGAQSDVPRTYLTNTSSESEERDPPQPTDVPSTYLTDTSSESVERAPRHPTELRVDPYITFLLMFFLLVDLLHRYKPIKGCKPWEEKRKDDDDGGSGQGLAVSQTGQIPNQLYDLAWYKLQGKGG